MTRLLSKRLVATFVLIFFGAALQVTPAFAAPKSGGKGFTDLPRAATSKTTAKKSPKKSSSVPAACKSDPSSEACKKAKLAAHSKGNASKVAKGHAEKRRTSK